MIVGDYIFIISGIFVFKVFIKVGGDEVWSIDFKEMMGVKVLG